MRDLPIMFAWTSREESVVHAITNLLKSTGDNLDEPSLVTYFVDKIPRGNEYSIFPPKLELENRSLNSQSAETKRSLDSENDWIMTHRRFQPGE